jgi:ADP-ribose pyrophosphatase YjhB (NUDIX family)
MAGNLKKKKFCCFCGGNVGRKNAGDKERDYCTVCGTIFYENPLPVASSILVNEDREVLLVKRKNAPYKGMWCLPIGFAEVGEDVHDAALRELEEETGVKGEIIRLIDVDTVDNYFYGSLAIVTYEVKMTGGKICPGDDALDAKFFSILDHPKLAWSSNEKAIQLYLEYHKDSWAMIDSFKQLFPEVSGTGEDISARAKDQRVFLSDILIKIIDKDASVISSAWADEVRVGIPALKPHLHTLVDIHKDILKDIQVWLGSHGARVRFEKLIDVGKDMKEQNIPLPDVFTAMALGRKAIWVHVIKKNILGSPLGIYTTLELNNRIILFYDKVVHFISKGYFAD